MPPESVEVGFRVRRDEEPGSLDNASPIGQIQLQDRAAALLARRNVEFVNSVWPMVTPRDEHRLSICVPAEDQILRGQICNRPRRRSIDEAEERYLVRATANESISSRRRKGQSPL